MTKKVKKKRTSNTKPAGKSKYALKIARRRTKCRQLGIPDTPLPLLEG